MAGWFLGGKNENVLLHQQDLAQKVLAQELHLAAEFLDAQETGGKVQEIPYQGAEASVQFCSNSIKYVDWQ